MITKAQLEYDVIMLDNNSAFVSCLRQMWKQKAEIPVDRRFKYTQNIDTISQLNNPPENVKAGRC